MKVLVWGRKASKLAVIPWALWTRAWSYSYPEKKLNKQIWREVCSGVCCSPLGWWLVGQAGPAQALPPLWPRRPQPTPQRRVSQSPLAQVARKTPRVLGWLASVFGGWGLWWQKGLLTAVQLHFLGYPGHVSFGPVNNILRFLAMWAYVAAPWPRLFVSTWPALDISFCVSRKGSIGWSTVLRVWGLLKDSRELFNMRIIFRHSRWIIQLYDSSSGPIYCPPTSFGLPIPRRRSSIVLSSFWVHEVLLSSASGLVMYWLCMRQAGWGLTLGLFRRMHRLAHSYLVAYFQVLHDACWKAVARRVWM